MSNIYNLFKFLEKKRGTETPIGVKLRYAPDEITDEELNVEDYLDLSFSEITSLPDGLKVRDDLDLFSSNLTSFPDNLKVGGDIFSNYSKISSIPNNLQVEKDLYLQTTPLAEKYDEEQIKKMIEDKGGYVKGAIYV